MVPGADEGAVVVGVEVRLIILGRARLPIAGALHLDAVDELGQEDVVADEVRVPVSRSVRTRRDPLESVDWWEGAMKRRQRGS